ncbi:hypothetical protein [Pedobacter sp.]|jgi:hypothetical protein|uniref:hypothetical protein n=1 Tax=Pedobacter sp. TaxID=1411316 RepID=UPI002C759554|nr:hypothetical protein [Pedobacter sp.]HWW41204.1 hypothetical protein [Pedobacter sp.]
MNFWKGFNIFWIIFLLFFAIGLPLILHYGGGLHKSDFEMIHTSASEAFVLLGLGTAFWFIVFIYYFKKFLINPTLKKNGIIRLFGLLLLIALAAGLLVYSYKNESHGYGWRYLYFWHPYVIIPGSFIFYSSFLFGNINGVFSIFLGKSEKPY